MKHCLRYVFSVASLFAVPSLSRAHSLYEVVSSSSIFTTPGLVSMWTIPEFNPSRGTLESVTVVVNAQITAATAADGDGMTACQSLPTPHGAEQAFTNTTTTIHFNAPLIDSFADFHYLHVYDCLPSGPGGDLREPPVHSSALTDMPITIEIPGDTALSAYGGVGYKTLHITGTTTNQKPSAPFSLTLTTSITYMYDETIFEDNFEAH